MSYKVQFLNDEEFDRLPAVNIQSKIGVAYPETGEAYVRRTGSNVLDVFTALHELEHLEGDALGEHYDEENKCYYKDFGQTLMAVAPLALGLIPGVGPAIGGALSSIGGGVASALGGVPLIGGALQGAAQSVGGALGSGLNSLGFSTGASPNVIKTGASANRALLEKSASPGNFASRARQPNIFPTGHSLGSNIASSAANSSLIGSNTRSALSGANSVGGQVASNAANNLAGSMFGGNGGPMEQFMEQSQGSYTPQTQTQPNTIAGQSGEGSQGGAGGAPGSVGGGAVSKLKAYLQQQDGGNGGNGPGGLF